MTLTRALLRARRRDDSGSLLLGLLMTIIVTGLVFVVTATVITGQLKTRSAHAFVIAGQAADSALANALVSANSQIDLSRVDAAHPVTFTDGDATSKWYATRDTQAQGCTIVGTPANPSPCTSYTVDAYGTVGGRTRHFTATLSGVSTLVGGGSNNGGSIAYQPSPGFGFGQAAFADKQINFTGGVIVDSYDSSSASPSPGAGMVSSNGTVNLTGGSTADKVTLWDYQAAPFSDRCLGSVCNQQDSVINQPARIDIATDQGLKFIDDHIGNSTGQADPDPNPCVQNGRVPQPWIASKAPTSGVLDPTGPSQNCYSSLDFDTNTTVTGTSTSPTVVYVTGTITVRPGVTVNVTSSNPSPAKLIIYSKGEAVTLGAGSSVAWAMWAPLADCNAGSGSGSNNPAASNNAANTYGSLVCARVSNGGGWRLHYDRQLGNITVGGSNARRVWSITNVNRQ